MLSASTRLVLRVSSHCARQQVTVAFARSATFASSRRVLQGSARSRWLSSTTTTGEDSSSFEYFEVTPPQKLSDEMAEGILDMTQFYVRHGVSRQRLEALRDDPNVPLVVKWQKMMEIFLSTQLYVINGLGYGGDEEGLSQYAQDFTKFLQETDDTTRDVLTEIRRDTWREMVGTTFGLDPDDDIPSLSIVEARNLMHKISSKLVSPDVLLQVQTRTARIQDVDSDIEIQLKHGVLQEIMVDSVYLGGSPSLVEEAGFGTGAKGYARLQFAMTEHEGDPLIAQYVSHAMNKLWEAADLDMSRFSGN